MGFFSSSIEDFSRKTQGVGTLPTGKFTTITKLIIMAFVIPAKRAVDSIAKLMTGLGLTIDEATLLSDGMNDLSNSMAASGAEILDVVRRAGSLGKQYGYAGSEAATFGAEMVATGAATNSL